MSDTGITGKNAYILFGGTVLNANFRTVSPSDSITNVDASAGSDVGITRLPTLRDSTFSIDLKRPASGTVNWISFTPGVEGTVEIGPEGTATGKPKQSVVAILQSRTTAITYNDITIDTLAFEQNDANGVIYSTY